MDSAAAELAAIRRTKGDLEELRKLLDSVALLMKSGHLQDVEIEKAYGRFFKHVVRISHNTLFSHFTESIADMVRKALPFSKAKMQNVPNSVETMLEQLYGVYDAIESSNPTKARTLVVEHIEYVETSLRRVIGNITYRNTLMMNHG